MCYLTIKMQFVLYITGFLTVFYSAHAQFRDETIMYNLENMEDLRQVSFIICLQFTCSPPIWTPLFLLTILMDKLYESNIHPSLWTIVNDLYTGMTTKVKWLGELSQSFPINQGVRQGGHFVPLPLQDLHKSVPN